METLNCRGSHYLNIGWGFFMDIEGITTFSFMKEREVYISVSV